MGSIRRPGKQYETPTHPWTKSRIDEERDLKREYGLTSMREIWKMRSHAKRFADQAKKLIVAHGEQAEKEKEQMFNKLQGWGLLSKEADLDQVLGLDVRDILERRLQTVVYKKGLARSMKQARQFITHNHIKVGDKMISVPSYIVPISEEEKITFVDKSTLADPEHPERKIKSESEVKKEAAAEGESSEEATEEKPEKEAAPEKDEKQEKAAEEKKSAEKPSEEKGEEAADEKKASEESKEESAEEKKE